MNVDEALDHAFAESRLDLGRSGRNMDARARKIAADPRWAACAHTPWDHQQQVYRMLADSIPDEERQVAGALFDEIEARTGKRIGDLMVRAGLWPVRYEDHRVQWNDRQREALRKHAPEVIP